MGRAGDFTLTPYRGTGQALQSSPIKGEEESRSLRGFPRSVVPVLGAHKGICSN